MPLTPSAWVGWTCLSAAPAIIAALAVHWASTVHELTLDDKFAVVRNPTLRQPTLSAFARMVLSCDYWGTKLDHPTSHQSFRPVTTLSFWLDLSGRTPKASTWQLHATSVVLHAACAALVTALALQLLAQQQKNSRLTGLLASFAGVFFAVHPATVEAVANISGRAEILAALFGVCAHLMVLNDYVITAFCFSLLALFSKEVGFTSVVLVLYHFNISSSNHHFKAKRIKKVLRPWRAAASGVAFALVVSLRLKFLHHMLVPSDMDNPLWAEGRTTSARWLSTLYVNARALAFLLLFPLASCPDFSGPACPAIESINGDIRNVYTLAAICAIALLLYACRRSCYRDARVSCEVIMPALLWMALPAALASNVFLRVGFCFAERTYYSSVIGLALLLCAFISKQFDEVREVRDGWEGASRSSEKNQSRSKRRGKKEHRGLFLRYIAIFLGGVGVCCTARRTWNRSSQWQSNEHLWSSAMQECEPTSRIVNNYGKVLQRSGKPREAQVQFERAMALDPNSALPYFNLGMLAAADRRHRKALLFYREATKRNPYLVGAFNNAGASHLALGEKIKAAKFFKQALDLNPGDSSIRANLRIALRI